MKGMRLLNRILSFVLVLIMVITVIPTVPVAATEISGESVVYEEANTLETEISDNSETAIIDEFAEETNEIQDIPIDEDSVQDAEGEISEDETGIAEDENTADVIDESEVDNEDSAIETEETADDDSEFTSDDEEIVSESDADEETAEAEIEEEIAETDIEIEVSDEEMEGVVDPVKLTLNHDASILEVSVVDGARKYVINPDDHYSSGDVTEIDFERGSKVIICYALKEYGYDFPTVKVNGVEKSLVWNKTLCAETLTVTLSEDTYVSADSDVLYVTQWAGTGEYDLVFDGECYRTNYNSPKIIATVYKGNSTEIPATKVSFKVGGKDYTPADGSYSIDKAIYFGKVIFNPSVDETLWGKDVEVFVTIEDGDNEYVSYSMIHINKPVADISVKGLGKDGNLKMCAGTYQFLPVAFKGDFLYENTKLTYSGDKECFDIELYNDGIGVYAKTEAMGKSATVKLTVAGDTVKEFNVTANLDKVISSKPVVKYNKAATTDRALFIDADISKSIRNLLMEGLYYEFKYQAKDFDKAAEANLVTAGTCYYPVDAFKGSTYILDLEGGAYNLRDTAVPYTVWVRLCVAKDANDISKGVVAYSEPAVKIDATTKKAYIPTKLTATKKKTTIIEGQKNVHVATVVPETKATYLNYGCKIDNIDESKYEVYFIGNDVFLSLNDEVIESKAKTLKTKMHVYVSLDDTFNTKNTEVVIPITIGQRISSVYSKTKVVSLYKKPGKSVSYTLKAQAMNNYAGSVYNNKIKWVLYDYNMNELNGMHPAYGKIKINQKGVVTVDKNYMVTDEYEDNAFYAVALSNDTSDNRGKKKYSILVEVLTSATTVPVKGYVFGQEDKTEFKPYDLKSYRIAFEDATGEIINSVALKYTTSKGITIDSTGTITGITTGGNHYVKATSINGNKSYTFKFKVLEEDDYNVYWGPAADCGYVVPASKVVNNDYKTQTMCFMIDSYADKMLKKTSIKIKSGGKLEKPAYNVDAYNTKAIFYRPTTGKTVIEVNYGGKKDVYTIVNNDLSNSVTPSISTSGVVYEGVVNDFDKCPQTVTLKIKNYNKINTNLTGRAMISMCVPEADVVSGKAANARKLYNNIFGGEMKQGECTSVPINSDGTFSIKCGKNLVAGKYPVYISVYDEHDQQITKPVTVNIKVSKQPKVTYTPATSYVINKSTREVKLNIKGTNANVVYYKAFNVNNSGKINDFCRYFEVVNNKLVLKDEFLPEDINVADLKGELYYVVLNSVTGEVVKVDKSVKVSVKFK